MWKSSALGLLFGALCAQDRLPFEGSTAAPALVGQVDVGAILKTWRIKGVLACGPDARHVCLWVENAYPCGVIEVVHQPFRAHLPEAEPLMAALRALKLPLSSSAGTERTETNLQFADTRVYTFVPPIVAELGIPIAVPRGPAFMVNYVSELDAFAWRTGLIDRLVRPVPPVVCEAGGPPSICAGRWGSYYPREGFLIHSSEPKAAYLQAVRAGRAASDPSGRFVMAPYPFEPRTGHMIQMVRPRWKSAVRIGAEGPIDEGVGSFNGAYLFIHLGIFEECRRCLPLRLVGPR